MIITMNYLIIIMIQEGCDMGREFKFKGSCDMGRGTKNTLNLPFSESSKESSGGVMSSYTYLVELLS